MAINFNKLLQPFQPKVNPPSRPIAQAPQGASRPIPPPPPPPPSVASRNLFAPSVGNAISAQTQPQHQITQPFGVVNPSIEKFSKGGINTGADFAAQVGDPVQVPKGNYQVVESYSQATKPGYIGNFENRGYGNSVLLRDAQTGEMIRLSHLSKTNLQPGQQFEGGQVGLTGQTGNVTGPHLDVEYYDPKGQLSDVVNTKFAKQLFGDGENTDFTNYQNVSQGSNFQAQQPQVQPQQGQGQAPPVQGQPQAAAPPEVMQMRQQLGQKLSDLQQQLKQQKQQSQPLTAVPDMLNPLKKGIQPPKEPDDLTKRRRIQPPIYG